MKILEANTHKEFASDQISHTADINVGYDAKSIFEPTALAGGLGLAQGAEGARYRLIREIVTNARLVPEAQALACAKVRHGSSTQTI